MTVMREIKPECRITKPVEKEEDIRDILSIASIALQKSGREYDASEMRNRIVWGEAGNCHHALRIIEEYVHITVTATEGVDIEPQKVKGISSVDGYHIG